MSAPDEKEPAAPDTPAPVAEEADRKVSREEAVSTIMGIVAGARAAVGAAADSLASLANAIECTKTGGFDLSGLVSKTAATQWDDEYTRAVCGSPLYIGDSWTAASMCEVGDAQANPPFVQAVWAGVFTKCGEYAPLMVACTHTQSQLLAVSTILANAVHDMIERRFESAVHSIIETTAELQDQKMMEEDDLARLAKDLTPATIDAPEPPAGPVYALWALHHLVRSSSCTGLVRSSGRDWRELVAALPPVHRAAAGAIMGAYLGFDGLQLTAAEISALDMTDVREFMTNIGLVDEVALIVDADIAAVAEKIAEDPPLVDDAEVMEEVD